MRVVCGRRNVKYKFENFCDTFCFWLHYLVKWEKIGMMKECGHIYREHAMEPGEERMQPTLFEVVKNKRLLLRAGERDRFNEKVQSTVML